MGVASVRPAPTLEANSAAGVATGTAPKSFQKSMVNLLADNATLRFLTSSGEVIFFLLRPNRRCLLRTSQPCGGSWRPTIWRRAWPGARRECSCDQLRRKSYTDPTRRLQGLVRQARRLRPRSCQDDRAWFVSWHLVRCPTGCYKKPRSLRRPWMPPERRRQSGPFGCPKYVFSGATVDKRRVTGAAAARPDTPTVTAAAKASAVFFKFELMDRSPF